jgi:hypothetical protein
MAGFTSNDQMISMISNSGKYFSSPFSKQFQPTAVAVANEWHTLTRGGGYPQADAIFDAGTNLLLQSLTDQTANAGSIYHGGDIGAAGDDFKTLLSAYAVTAAATVVPATIQLIDVLAFFRVTTVTTTTAQTVIWPYDDGTAIGGGETVTFSSSSGLLGTYTNDVQNLTKVRFRNSGGALPTGLTAGVDYYTIRVSATTCRYATSRTNAIAGTAIAYTDAGTGTNVFDVRLPRYSDGKGVQALFFNPQATALGAGTPQLTLGYQNSAGTTARATPTSPSAPIGKTAATSNHVLYTGATGAGKFGAAIPLQAADAGIRTIQTVRNNATYTSGMYAVMLYVPLAEIPLQVLGQATFMDYTQAMFPSFPRVYDGAALYWLLKSGVATPVNSQIDGRLNFGWS